MDLFEILKAIEAHDKNYEKEAMYKSAVVVGEMAVALKNGLIKGGLTESEASKIMINVVTAGF